MNIFMLSADPARCAEMHTDKHVVKMFTEQLQLLSTAHHHFGSTVHGMYKATHANHPSAVWARESSANYEWLWRLTVELGREYTRRYGKVRKAVEDGLVDRLRKPPKNIPTRSLTKPKPAMPDEYVVSSPVQSYRNYYAGAKSHLFVWTNRRMPNFLAGYGYEENFK